MLQRQQITSLNRIWPVSRPFSIVLVKLAFNATRNSRKKPKNAKIMPDFKKCHLNSKNALFYFKQNVQILTLYADINNR